MIKITDFPFKMQIICSTLNRTIRSYAKNTWIGPERFYELPEVTWISYLVEFIEI